jgi:hypothetical protein
VQTRGPAVVWALIGFFVGLLPTFWLAGPAFFADGPLSPRLGALALYAGAVLVCGVAGGALAPSRRVAVAIGLFLPVLAVLLLATWGAAETIVLAVAFVAIGAAAAWVGTWAGAVLTGMAMAARSRR